VIVLEWGSGCPVLCGAGFGGAKGGKIDACTILFPYLMLNEQEVHKLSQRLDRLSCTNPKVGNGLFTFVMLGEPADQKPAYEKHMAECEYCRVALEVYRYKRDAAKLVHKWETAKRIVSLAQAKGSGVVERQLGEKTAYFEPGEDKIRGIVVMTGPSGKFLSVEEKTKDEFERL
jgi:hypothetical protein